MKICLYYSVIEKMGQASKKQAMSRGA